MLADKRSETLVTNFADQWLHLQNLKDVSPDLYFFPDFDRSLSASLRRETQLLFDSIVRDDASVERLAVVVRRATAQGEDLAPETAPA